MLDPNHARTQAESPEGVVLVPLSVDGKKTTIHQNAGTPDVIRGRRSSPRELLHEVKAAHPDRLTIWTDTLVTRVLFAPGETSRAPIGVEYQRVPRLYRRARSVARASRSLAWARRSACSSRHRARWCCAAARSTRRSC